MFIKGAHTKRRSSLNLSQQTISNKKNFCNDKTYQKNVIKKKLIKTKLIKTKLIMTKLI